MSGVYNRYLVFEWDEYDNSDPIPDVDSSFDDYNKADAYAKNNILEGFYDFAAIFDLEEKRIVKKYCCMSKKDDFCCIGFVAIQLTNQL